LRGKQSSALTFLARVHDWKEKMEYCICKVSRAILAFAFVALATERSFAGTGNILSKEGSSGSSSAAAAAYYGGNQAALSQLPTNANDILARTNQAIQSVQAMQQAARNAALGGANNLGVNPQNPQQRLPDVPNGLIPGGLQVATGQNAEWSGANQPAQSVVNGRTMVTIQQTASRAILNWQTFNVGKNTTAYFNQSGGGSSGNTWIALNRVLDPSGVPSQILGSIVAQGSVYVINQNGIIFGGASQVNTNSFIASAVGLTDTQFKVGGIQNPQPYTISGYYAVINPPTFVNNSGPTGDIVVKAGAVIQTSPPASVKVGGGSVYLFGSDVENDGWIITPDGQTVLAATGQPSVVVLPIGSSGVPGLSPNGWPTGRTSPQAYTFPSDVYLTASTNPNIRGVTVLMDNGGTVTNNGLIVASTGNITMTGMNVRQSGILAATTSVDQAGSITLFAGSGGPIYNGTLESAGLTIVANNPSTGYVVAATQTGTVTLSSGSITTVLPDENGAVAMDTQTQPQSIISIEGQTINILSNSTIFAPSGQVSLEASSIGTNLYADDNPGILNRSFPDLGSRILVDSGALVDVSGLQDISVPAQDDAVQVNVRANELRDSPLQRNGILESQNVWVNINGLNTVVPGQQVYTAGGLLEVSGWLGLTERPIDQRLTTGGSIVINSGGDAILRPQSSIGIAGGWLYHQAGYVPVTWLLGADGHLYTVNNAPADLTYVSIGDYYGVNHPRWGIKESYANPMLPYQTYEGAYVEGKPAGSLSIVAPHAELDASVNASVVSGPFQRTATTLPAAGSLTIGGWANPTQVVIAPVIAPPVLASNTSPLPDDWQKTLYLSADLLDQAGYGSISISTGALQVNENASVEVAPGGSITVNASSGLTTTTAGLTTTTAAITISGSLIAPGGSVSLYANSAAPRLVAPPTYDIVLEPGSLIDTRGLWVNDFVDRSAVIPTLYNGGNVTIRTYDDVRIDTGAVIDASSGGWVQINGKIKANNNGLPVGTGGNITLIADDYALQTASSDPTQASTVPETYPTQVYLDGTVRSFGFTAGGQLTIVTPGIQIGVSLPASSNQAGLGTTKTQGSGTTQTGGAPTNVTTPLLFSPSFFATTGFSQYTLYSYQGVTIASGTDLELHAVNFVPNAGTIFAPSGSNPANIAPIGRAPAYELPGPVNLLLSATDAFVGDLVFGHGAIINADPQATIALHARHQLTIDGTIYAPAGTIALDLTGSSGPIVSVSGSGPAGAPFDAPFPSPDQTLWIGSDARLLAPGLVQSFTGPNGSVTNVLLDGGTVNIDQDLEHYYPYPEDQPAVDIPLGTVVAKAGAVIDVSGANGTLYQYVQPNLSGSLINPLSVSSNGGTIAVTASMGLFFDATMKATGGGPRSAGGNFVLDQVAGNYTSNASNPTFVQPVFLLVISQSNQMLSTGIQLGQAIPSSYAGELFISADQIMNSGFSSASLGAVDALVFNGNVELSLSRSLRINARNIGDGTVTPLSEVGTDIISDGAVVAPLTGAVVTLSAPYVNIGGGQRGGTTEYIGGIASNTSAPPSATGTPVVGTAVLNINADLIDIEGLLRTGATYQYLYNGVFNPITFQTGTLTPNPVSLAGFKAVSFNSTGDIRLLPMTSVLSGPSLLTTLGNLNFTATEIYPVTSAPQSYASNTSSNTLFEILASGMNSVITFARTGAAPYIPLSAAGAVQIDAPTINQGGVIVAPLGQITFGDPNSSNLQATNINLLPGSITSVAATGTLIPYGSTFGNTQWNYNSTLFAPPQKLIAFYGQNITVSGASGGKAAALIDESGGGDIYATQFISGAGGSTDTLNGTETFAILPSLGNHYAPVDPVMQSSNPNLQGAPPVALTVGDQVYLTSIPGLPAGYYTLLPGHYALLPGAYKLTVEASQTTTAGLSNLGLPDGSYQVIGYRTVANTSIQDSLPSVFIVSSGSVVREHSEYTEATGNSFFPALATTTDTVTPYLARDAGHLIIDITSNAGNFVFQGTSNFSYPTGALGGQADIVVGNLDILGPGDTAQAGYVGIQASQLDALGVQSLLLGGVRNLSLYSTTLDINPSAQAIIVDANAVLRAPEIMLTATGGITVAANARIDSTGYAPIPAQFLLDPITGKTLGSITLTNPGAFLLVSNAVLDSEGNPLPVTQNAGTAFLTIDPGASIYAGSTLFLGAQTISIDPNARFGGQTITVQTPVIAFGSGASTGLILTNNLLAALSEGDASHGVLPTGNLILNATQEIDVYGSASLGIVNSATGLPLLAQLTLATPVINGFGGANDNVSITAGKVFLQGTGATLPSSGTSTGQGQFIIDATEVVLGGGGIMTFNGFSNVTLAATGDVTSSKVVATSFSGQTVGGITYSSGQIIPGIFDVFGNLIIQTPLVTSVASQPQLQDGAGAVTQLIATGAVSFLPATSVTSVTSVALGGATLKVNAPTIVEDTKIVLPS
jgi:filamentous hemagglutinin